MNLKSIGIIYRKEFVDLIRDRRTLISMVLVPVLVMPLLILGMGYLTTSSVKKARSETPRIMLLGGEDSPRIMEVLRAREDVRWVPASPDFTNQISDKSLRAALEIPEGFDAALEAGEPASVRIYQHQGEMKSGFASRTLETVLREYRENVVTERLEARSVPRSVLEPFSIRRENVAAAAQVTGQILGGLLPYMVILLCMTGGMYPAMDLTAGEKERGTMETLLCSPVSRTSLVLGKFLMVLTAAVTTAVLSLGSLAVAFFIGTTASGGILKQAEGGGGLPLAVDPASVLGVFVMILPIAFFLAAAELALSLFARSFKEAQTYLTPLLFAVILPAVASMTPGIELNWKLAWVPVLNTSLASKEIMSGNWPWEFIVPIFLTNSLYAILALWAAVRLFHRESVIMRG